MFANVLPRFNELSSTETKTDIIDSWDENMLLFSLFINLVDGDLTNQMEIYTTNVIEMLKTKPIKSFVDLGYNSEDPYDGLIEIVKGLVLLGMADDNSMKFPEMFELTCEVFFVENSRILI